MIFRLTQKLGKKIRETPSHRLPPDANPFADWSAHLFTVARVQYIILTNTRSLYSIVFYGRGITDGNSFIRDSVARMRDFMTDDGNAFFFRRFIEPRASEIRFSKSGDRGVLGSMNDLIYNAKLHLAGGELLPFDVSFKLNKMPMSYLDYEHPEEAFRNLKIGERRLSVV